MTSRLPLLLLGLSTLGACAGIPKPEEPPVATWADRHEIEVAQTAQRLELGVVPGDTTLDAGERAQVDAFASGYLRYGHGALVMSTPSGGANSDAANAVAGDARRALLEAGVSYAAVANASYDAMDASDAPIVLSFTRYEAQAPDCTPLWQQDLGHQSNNQPWESFGCATQANLAALVEDPADLLRPRAEDPRDSARRDTVMGLYREGDTTHAERSNDERVTISNAVQ
jgi:pilus assembly protein CpaD